MHSFEAVLGSVGALGVTMLSFMSHVRAADEQEQS